MTTNKDQAFTVITDSNLQPPVKLKPKRPAEGFFARILHKQFVNSKRDKDATHYCDTPASLPATPLPQKLFFKPGVIEEEEEMEYPSRAESPLMYRASNYILSPSISGLNRTSTCNSTLSQMAGRQDSR